MKTIFDLGMHRAQDTAFYLAKGFRVVALEANPSLCAAARERFADPIRQGQLVVVHKALSDSAGARMAFFVRSDAKDDWSSADQAVAERDGVASDRVEVQTTTIGELFAEFGVPHYLKCDLEGADDLVIEQLRAEDIKPRFVSVEAGEEPVGALARCGYGRFQIVNQGYLDLFRCPYPPREGQYVPSDFRNGMSGMFGEELDLSGWVGADEASDRLARWRELASGNVGRIKLKVLKKYGKLTRKTWLIHTGWVDIHARRDG